MLTAAVAFLAVVIAWGQWYTARQKLILDLFEKRVKVLEGVDLALREVAYPRGEFNDWGSRMSEFREKARYLFGSEIHIFLLELDNSVYQMLYAHWVRKSGTLSPSEIAETAADLKTGSAAIKRYRAEFPSIFAPYLRMDQKLPRPPIEWPGIWVAAIKDRFKNRPTGHD